MMIERLAFGEHNQLDYDPEEACIHVTRYQIAKDYVPGKRVLDIACGEGYGSLLLKNWGAKSVLGVDISQSSIDVANQYFARDDVKFLCQNAERISSEEKFDVIISFETIEHVADELSFLKSLKNMLADNGVIILSCPNDHWYYKEHESNPFHLRKYTFEDFKIRTSSVFGKSTILGLGTNVFGFGNVVLDQEDVHCKTSLLAESIHDIVNQINSESLVSKSIDSDVPTHQNCLYYFGIWDYRNRPIEQTILGHNVFVTSPIQGRFKNLKDYKIAYEKCNQLVIDRDKYIKELEQLVKLSHPQAAKKDRYITELQQLVKSSEKLVIERDKYIKELLKLVKASEKLVIERDKYIKKLEQRRKV